MKLGEAIYKAQAEAEAETAQSDPDEGGGTSREDDVVDADFEEVDGDSQNKRNAG